MKIAVVGTGYVGLVSGVCLASKGHNVICVDKKQEIVEKIKNSIPPIYEKGLEELLKNVVKNNKLIATTDIKLALKDAEVVLIAVGTPYQGDAIDLSYIKMTAEEIGKILKESDRYMVITIKSTVIPTTTDTFVKEILEKSSGKKAGIDFGLAMNPEFLREGNAIEDFMVPDRVVIGAIDDKSFMTVKKVYETFEVPIIQTNLRTAEMIKYTSNSLLATMISFSNEIGNTCAQIGGIDVREVMNGVHLDKRLSPVINKKRITPGLLSYIEAGCGFGGSCFPKDVKAIIAFAKKQGADVSMLSEVININETQPTKVLDLLKKSYPNLKNLNIGILGLAFKPDTDDTRESPAIKVANSLIKEGANVTGYDPIVKEEFNEVIDGKISYANDIKTLINDKDAIIILTRWDDFKIINQEMIDKLMKKPIIIDGRRMLNKKDFKIGSYFGIGYSPR